MENAQHTPGPCRVVRLDWPASGRVWDVYCDDIGDYLATMNPALPVDRKSVAERICEGVNARHAAIAKATGAA